MSGGLCEGREMCASRFLRHVCSSGERECRPPNADASMEVFSIDDISNRLGAAMDPLGMHDPNQGKEPTGTRRLSRRSWFALAGAAGLASFGGYSLVAGLRSPDPRWTAPLPGYQAEVAVAAADDSALYAYVHDARGAEGVVALDSATGAQRWDVRLDSPLRGVVAMIPAGDAFVIGAGDMVSARDAATGRLLWLVPRSRWSEVPGATVRSAGLDVTNGVVVAVSANGIVALDLRTGDRVWNTDVRPPGGAFATSTEVAAHNGMLFSVNSCLIRVTHGVSYQSWIDAWDVRTGQPAWSTEVKPSFGTSDLWIRATGDLVVASDGGRLVVLDAATGQRRWDGLGGSVVIAGDVLARLYENWSFADVHGLDLADGTERWSLQDLDASDEDAENAVLHIVGGEGIVYIGEPDEPPVALDAASGSKLWTYRGQRRNATATVIAAHGRAVYLAAGGQIEAITTT
jgi:outer membrane protein assembly factor BamB